MLSRSEILELYRERLGARRDEKERHRARLAWIAYARLAVFGIGVAIAWFVWETEAVSWPWLSVPLAVFLLLVWIHAGRTSAFRRTERAERFYLHGIARLEDRWAGEGLTGSTFADPEHPYSGDLDIFGRGSVFELLATTKSVWGAETLANWLKQSAPPEEIPRRQQAVQELAPLLELREAIASEPGEVGADVDSGALADWAAKPPRPVNNVTRLLVLAFGLANLVLAITWLMSWTSRLPFLVTILSSGAVAMALRPWTREVLSGVEEPFRSLSLLSSMLERFERESFTSSLLVELQEELGAEGEPASKQIHRLSHLIDLLDARRNQLFAPIAAMLLWGTQFAFLLERFRVTAGPSVPRWLAAVGKLDALLALGTYHFEHPECPFPEIVEGDALFIAEGLGHPLIPSDRLVRNDLRIGGELRLMVVSGSNMSGKSTLLRAIGVNSVLGLAGAPVTATQLRISPMRVAASIRVQDSLQDGISHFYAEILRLRQVMELAGGEIPLLFLLDEILHGTNSHDRRIGAEAVVRGLIERGAIGLMTTHDLALSQLAETLGDGARNVHFEDEIVDGEIRFDYVMRPGVVKKSNALDLMRSIGLEV
jgi:hypothetical protein